ncbi:MAG TPA: PIN domain-containing protein [Polyangia bacterium]|jgi:hypothetical protein|nr:PIN domain-containing protein [Polyangia bacterium]
MILVDTSVWIESFRRGGRRIDALVSLDDVVSYRAVCRKCYRDLMMIGRSATPAPQCNALAQIESPLAASVFDEAVDLYRAARKRGLTVRSSVDCLIAACALRHDLEVLHRDRDYEALASVSLLRQRNTR